MNTLARTKTQSPFESAKSLTNTAICKCGRRMELCLTVEGGNFLIHDNDTSDLGLYSLVGSVEVVCEKCSPDNHLGTLLGNLSIELNKVATFLKERK